MHTRIHEQNCSHSLPKQSICEPWSLNPPVKIVAMHKATLVMRQQKRTDPLEPLAVPLARCSQASPTYYCRGHLNTKRASSRIDKTSSIALGRPGLN